MMVFKVLALFVVLVTGKSAFALTSSDGEWSYEIVSGLAELTGCAGACPTEMIIPDEIDGFLVAGIDNNAFIGSEIETLVIGENVLVIGRSAFRDNRLTSVVIPDNVRSIYSRAFANNRLTSLSLGQKLEVVGFNSFSDNLLVTLTISNWVREIDGKAFYNNELIRVYFGQNLESIGESAFASERSDLGRIEEEAGPADHLGESPG